MNITNAITDGMTAQEKEMYFKHMEKRHREEKEKLEYEKQLRMDYREQLIQDILKMSKNFTEEELRKKSISTLERIYDYC